MASDSSSAPSSSSTSTGSAAMADESANNLYFLPANENPGLILTSQPLTGPENYMTWARSVFLALSSRNKFGFVNGSISEPNPTSPLFNSWNKCNTTILSWLTNSLSPDLKASVMYINSAKDLWIDLKNRLSLDNTPRLFELEKDISHLVQGSLSMFVEEVMDLVELNSIRESIVGSPNVNGLSTEQRKRLTIATELVANPSIIFMDEPTSGLDARAAAIVMRTVRNTVDTGRTVVCTIHQPSIDIFDAFDELYLLKSGGQEIYVGPIGHRASHLISYFEGIRGVKKIRDGINPATWMLEVTNAAQEAVLGVNFSDVYNNSELCRRNKVMVKELSKPQPMSKDLHFATQFSQSFWTQCKACLWKQHWSYWRNPQYNAVRLLFSIFIALIFGSMFWDLGPKRIRQQDIFNSVGSMYVASLFIGIQNAALVQPVVAVERTVFYRERAAGLYSALPYAIAQITIEIPYIFIQAVIYAPIVYFMIGFETTASKFFLNFFFMYFTFLYFTFFGMLTVAITPNYSIAAVVSVFFYALWNLFLGFLITRLFMPVWWIWFYWACPFAWTLYGLICAQFGDSKDRLDTGLTVEELMKSYFGFKTDFLGVVSIVIIGITLLFGVGFALAIKVLNFQRR